MTTGRKRPPLREELSLFEATVAREGTTTAPGAAAGNSIVDVGLAGAGANSFLSMLMVVYPGQPRLVDSMDITAFNDITGEVTLASAYKGVAAPIPAGVPYKIVTFRFVPAEVAALTALVTALMVDVGDASTAILGSIFGILGDPAIGEDLATRIGYEGALSLADKLTAARAALLDEITALRMAELDPAGLPADVAAVAVQLVAVLADTTALLVDTAAIIAAIAALNDLAQADILSDATPFAGADVAAIKTETDKLPGDESAGIHNHSSNLNWQGVDIIATTTRKEILAIWLDFVNLTQDVNMRLQYKIDGTNYRTFWSDTWKATGDDGVLINCPRGINNDLALDLQSVVAEGALRGIPYCIIYRDME